MAEVNVDNENLLVKDVVDDEYSTNFFNFTSKDVHDGVVKLMIPQAIAESTERLKKCLLQKCKGYDKEIELACTELLNESLAAVPRLSKPLMDLTDMYFKIPKDVLLEQDLMQNVQYNEEDVKKMDMEIAALEDRITKASFMEAYLEEELALAARFNETVTDTNAVDFTSELANIASSDPFIPKLTTYVENFNDAKKKNTLIASKAYHEAGLQAIKRKGDNEIYDASP